MKVNAQRLLEDLETLAHIGRNGDGGISRTAFSAEDAAARQWYKDRCDASGLELRCDGLGNMTAGLPGSWEKPAIWSGSHIDTVPSGGSLDGALGAVAALECVRRIAEEDLDLTHPVQSVVFADEEGNYSHLFGSYGLVHGYDTSRLDSMAGREGDSLATALQDFPWRTGDIYADHRIDPGRVRSFIELHIEQGPRLEAEGIAIGIVRSIVGLGGGEVVFIGRPDHAGTTPMTMRRDPTRAAGAFLTRLAGVAASVSGDAVATCGLITLEPGGTNVVPERAHLSLDFRAPDVEQVDALARNVTRIAHECAAAHNVECEMRLDPAVQPVDMDAGIRDHINAAARRCDLSTIIIPSGAGHDSQNLAQIAPTGMIFVPSHDGRSHSRFEHTDPDLLVNGANVLLEALMSLAR
ncbi:Zn-dependent hydrolase [Leekyejoonella antrihumi]|uniref:Zn-dependent hydrolase n=1 Tax=Leekyejoonella antrihumi TaxID=1660198 RepID=A0A563E8F7_9MICO|nr:Zn-dependent hydrolase [Leekyejoonella antrihumi]TWP38533.1 Zn-dependent hydrolase [Leekyejoonella antrihumi]